MKVYTYPEVLSHLSPLSAHTIIVTGPQRSGTTIAAHMLAEKAAARLVAEEKFEVDRLDLFFRILDQAVDRIVVQAPGLAWCAHELPVDVLIYMWRPDIEISNSIDRIKWDQNSRENEKMLAGPSTMVRSWSHRKIKWETRQHAICRARQVFTLDYHSLAGHPGWRDKSERANFHARQIQ